MSSSAKTAYQEGGEKEWISIRRLKCAGCKHLHNELPDILTPYKHYETEIISGVIDGVVSPDDEATEDYPYGDNEDEQLCVSL